MTEKPQSSDPTTSTPIPKQFLTQLPFKDKVAKRLDNWLDVVHVVGSRLLGPLWMTLFESVQDAITLGLIVKIPSILSKWTIGQEFSGLDACWTGNSEWSVARYACYAVVISDYTLWAVLISRIVFRFFRDLRTLFRQGGGHD